MMMRIAAMTLMAPAVLAAGSHHVEQDCACAQADPAAPFTIDCDDEATIRTATVTLETTCAAAQSYEWGGAFSTPANAYTWVAEAVDGAYADPEMKLVAFSIDTADAEHLTELAANAKTLMDGTCTVVNTQGTIPAPTASGACYTLTFPTDASVDFHATVTTTGVSNVAFFTAHVPTEFERDTHYFMSTDLATDIEPAAETDAKEYNCKVDADSNGLKVCQQAFLIIQAHHDYCEHDTLTTYEEELFHEWESKCFGCNIKRKYNATLNACPMIDCSDTSVAELGYQQLQSTCVAADTTYAFEFAGVFDTPGNTYTWVSQAATANASLPSGYQYADAEMMIVAIAMDSNIKSALHAQKDTADQLMQSACSTTITASCTPGDTSCTMPTLRPVANGVCRTITFPADTAKDFMATIDTTGVAHVAFFTAHLPTEFERDTHYFMSTDLATDIEPANILGAAASHDHGRRLSATPLINERYSHRRLANPGTCCTTNLQRGAWKQVVAYHDLCAHDEVPSYIEVGFHDYEASCEDYFCNLVGPDVDQTVCQYAPPSPPSSPPVEEGVAAGAVIGIVVACAVVILLVVGFLCVMISKEKAGKPIFSSLDGGKTPAVQTSNSA